MARAADDEFDEFVRSSWRRLSKAAYALTGNRHDAEDLLQAVLERTYLRWSSVRTNPIGYVRRALVHRYVDGWRRRRRLSFEGADQLPETAIEGGIGDAEQRTDLRVLLGELSDRERAMVVLRYYLDCSEHDVAAELGCSVGTVKSTCSRALARLRIPSPTLEGTSS